MEKKKPEITLVMNKKVKTDKKVEFKNVQKELVQDLILSEDEVEKQVLKPQQKHGLSKKLSISRQQSTGLIPQRIKKLGLIQTIRQSTNFPLYRVVLTGGPCGGKSSAMELLQKELSKKGFFVYVVPETPTITAEGGGMIQMDKLTHDQIIDFQANLIQFQMQIEDYFLSIAIMKNQPAVLLMDRGTCDPHAYVTDEDWQVILDQQQWNINTLRDFRYNAVIHLVSAAYGAEKFYSLDNKARYENVEQAREKDQAVLDAYVGHPHHFIIDNNAEPKSFKTKLNRVLSQLMKVVGQDYDSQFNKAFLLNNYSQDDMNISLTRNDIKFKNWRLWMTVLDSENENVKEYVQKRGNQNYTYCHIIIRKPYGNQSTIRQEQMTQLTPQEYHSLRKQKREGTQTVQALVTTFPYKHQIFNVKIFNGLKGSRLSLLHLETDIETKNIQMPIFLKVLKDISLDRTYSTDQICKTLF